MRHIGIECESIEEQTWGVGRIVLKLLENISKRPELAKNYKFHLYFKAHIPDFHFLNSPIFEKHIVWQPLPHKSFVIYYYVFLPICLWFSKVRTMFYPNYMIPIIHPPYTSSLVLMTDDIYYERSSRDQKFRHRLAYWVFGTWAVWRATKIMAISETSKKEVARLFKINPTRIFVDPLGVDAPSPIPANGYHLMASNYFLFVAQAFPRRHLRESLLAFELLAPKYPDINFVAVGPDKYSPPEIGELVKKINNSLKGERVIWKERVSDKELGDLYSKATATIYVSDREAFGLPPIEALAYGSVPVIADNELGHEIFGDNAFYVKTPITSANISNELKNVLTDETKRSSIISAGKAIVEKYSWTKFTDKFIIEISKH